MSLPEITLDQLAGGPNSLVLCARARQAQALRLAHGRLQAARGATRWQPLEGAAYAQWLDRLCTDAILDGDLPASALPGGFLTGLQEHCLWRRAIAEDLGAGEAELFDIEALARNAQAADLLRVQWHLETAAGSGTEAAAWLRWRGRVERLARETGLLTAGAALAWRLDCVERGLGRLPGQLLVAGGESAEPCWQRLLRLCVSRGSRLAHLRWPGVNAARCVRAAWADEAAEAAAAARWAAQTLREQPQARLRIALADLPTRQAQFTSALDAELHPEWLGAPWASAERRWACERQALDAQFEVDLALRLLAAAVPGARLEFAALGDLLRGPGWAGDVDEADARARFEAAVREHLPPRCTLADWSRLASAEFSGLAMPRTRAALAALADFARGGPSRRTPSAWAQAFEGLLNEIEWPGQRAQGAVQTAGRRGFLVALRSLAALEGVTGKLDQAAALRLLRQTVSESSWRLPRQSAPAIELVGLDDALGAPVDGLWVAGLTAGEWPPQATPNPLLPAAAQRAVGLSAACGDLLAAQARVLQADWARHADEVVLSWARQGRGRAQQPSPLLADLSVVEFPLPPEAASATRLQCIDDRQAPAPDAAELARLAGGSALLAAQAACPAWAFHRYRLGAKALTPPLAGLDAAARGELLHAALEALWRGRDQAWLLALDAPARDAAIDAAVDRALARLAQRRPGRLGLRGQALERERLHGLLATWLELEAQRSPFSVVECEARHAIDLAGLQLRVVVDRLDRLADGRNVLIDYKSGRQASSKGWAEPRPDEPQLPLYAIAATPGEVAAVALARVASERMGFDGVAAEAGLLPKLAALDAQRARYPVEVFADWSALLATWRERLEALAQEFLAGEAAVRADEGALQYCEVRPLLRLAERRAQFEREGEA